MKVNWKGTSLMVSKSNNNGKFGSFILKIQRPCEFEIM